MKVNVNLFTPSGKWKYGGIVQLNEKNQLGDSAHKQELIDNQNFVVDGTFDHYIVVVTHRDDYDADPSPYFCQQLYPVGAFAGMRKTNQ
ncbi:MAG: hypothetical protein HY856_13470 [Burkholderiales bacterium]|nr:hypothetical protein [Burkholderiales bacterium]